MSETSEQQALFDLLGRLEGRHPHFKYIFHPANEANGGGAKVRIKRGDRWSMVPVEVLSGAKMGVKAGCWDIWAPFYNRAEMWGYPAGTFVGLVIEMKSAKGTLSPEQEDWRAFLRDEGWACQMYRDWPTAARTLIQWVGGDPDLEMQGL